MYDSLREDPYGYADIEVYPSETSSALHPHLEGIEKDYWFIVIEDRANGTSHFGPYRTFNAAQSLTEKRGAGCVVQLHLA